MPFLAIWWLVSHHHLPSWKPMEYLMTEPWVIPLSMLGAFLGLLLIAALASVGVFG